MLVAAIIGVLTVGLREVLGALFPATPAQYAWSMLLSYGVGVVLSYFAQGRITFRELGHRASPQGLRGFVLVAVLSSLLTVLLAYLLRFGLPLEDHLPALAAPLAFAGAALLVAPVSFLLGRRLVYREAAEGPCKREAWWVWPIVLLLVSAHASTFGSVFLRWSANGLYDEALFLRLARSLAQGEWLGAYTPTSLVKGPGFSLWLAAVHMLHVPAAIAASVTYALACLLVFLALRPVIPGSLQRLLVFAALLACPAALSDFGAMRELIYPASTLSVVACGLGMVTRLEQSWHRPEQWFWAAGLGLASALFCLTREEWVWLAPCWAGMAMWAWWVWYGGGAKFRALVSALGFALLFAALPVLAVASLNRHHYGVFEVLEINSRPFVSAYGALARVRHEAAPPQVPVPREVWARIASVSPSFAEVNAQLQGGVSNIWLGPSASLVGRLMDDDPAIRRWLSDRLQVSIPLGELGGAAFLQDQYRRDERFRSRIELFLGGRENAQAFFSGVMEREAGGGWFVWMLREAVVASGHHASASDADRFYQRLADEVNAACSLEKLQCLAERHTLFPVLQWRYWDPYWSSLAYAADQLLTLPTHSSGGVTKSMGDPAALAEAEAFLHGPLAASRATLAPVAAIEALILASRYALPWLFGFALFGWLLSVPLPRRRLGARHFRLWLIGGLLLVLVSGRLALLALIHVSSWPAADDVRYLSAAQPLLLLFTAIGPLLLVSAWGDVRSAHHARPKRR